MRKQFLLFTALFSATLTFGKHAGNALSDPDKRRFQVQFNKNVELLGFVYFLGYEGAQAETAGYSPKTKARYAFGLDLYQQYKSHANSRHLAVAVGFAENIWLDYFINLLIQLEDFPHAKLTDAIDITHYQRFSPTKDPLEARKNATVFIEAMNKLWEEVDFDSYLKQNSSRYENASAQVTAGLPDSLFIPAMEKFYQSHLDSYILVPSLTIPPGMGFGIKYVADRKTLAFHVFGAFGLPDFRDTSKLNMGFDDKKHLLELSTHEFGHSFVNPAIGRLPDTLINGTQKLFAPIKDAMSNQGYTTWKACLTEHFVRAGEIIIAESRGNAADALRLKDSYLNDRKFIYLPIILEAYNQGRKFSYDAMVGNAMKRLIKEAGEIK